MSADWFFIKKGFFSSSHVGPVSESELLRHIEKGEIGPRTMLCSKTKTRGEWVQMYKVAPAYSKWQTLHGEQQ